MSEYELHESLQRLEAITTQLAPAFDRLTAFAQSLELAAHNMAQASLSFEAAMRIALQSGLDLTKPPSKNGTGH